MSDDPVILDMRGQRCPLPIIALGRRARTDPGTQVRLLADDPAAAVDVPAWCRMTGGHLVAAEFDEDANCPRYDVALPSPPGRSKAGGNASSPGSAD